MTSLLDQPYDSEQALIERFAAIGLDKQHNLAEIIGERDWQVDLDQQKIYFGDDLSYSIQVLGSFSFDSESWLWAWANVQQGLAPELIQQANALKAYGEQHNISFLTEAMSECEETTAHLVGMLASGLFANSCYYAARHEHGIFLVSFTDPAIDAVASLDQARISSVFPQIISLFEMNHHNALQHYLTDKEFRLDKVSPTQIVAHKHNVTVSAAFDELSRLTALNVE